MPYKNCIIECNALKTWRVFNKEKIKLHQEPITIQTSDSVLPTATALGLDCELSDHNLLRHHIFCIPSTSIPSFAFTEGNNMIIISVYTKNPDIYDTNKGQQGNVKTTELGCFSY